MSTQHQEKRKEQARLEVGRTQIARPVAAGLVVLFLLMIATPPLAELGVDLRAGNRPTALGAAVGGLSDGLREAVTRISGEKLAAANDALSDAIERAEEELEDDSLLRRTLLEPVQRFLTRFLKIGNEQAYVGHDGWLFFRPDYDYSIGRGFLDPVEMERRRRDPDASPQLQPDPIVALEHFARTLAATDVRLLVLPVPGKSVIHPELVAPARRAVRPPVHNPSFPEFLRRLQGGGIAVYDPTPDLLTIREEGAAAFLRTDSHWTPLAVERVAAGIAGRLSGPDLGGFPAVDRSLVSRKVRLSGRGDLPALLDLDEGSPFFGEEQIEANRVLTLDGRSWRPTSPAPLLLLGDSFSNVFSDPSLGWGTGAGLAEQIALGTGWAVDRIARNAGGASASREELARELAAGSDRLSETRVVIYQFAARELVSGDWRLVDFGGATGS